MKLTVRPLTPDLWPAFEDLFGKSGACSGCWGMYWRIGSGYHKQAREMNKAAFRKVVKHWPAYLLSMMSWRWVGANLFVDTIPKYSRVADSTSLRLC